MNNQVLNRMRNKQQEILTSLDELVKADREMLRIWKEANRR
jgi:hypothetical protein